LTPLLPLLLLRVLTTTAARRLLWLLLLRALPAPLWLPDELVVVADAVPVVTAALPDAAAPLLLVLLAAPPPLLLVDDAFSLDVPLASTIVPPRLVDDADALPPLLDSGRRAESIAAPCSANAIASLNELIAAGSVLGLFAQRILEL
jgi:hypothetical protein